MKYENNYANLLLNEMGIDLWGLKNNNFNSNQIPLKGNSSSNFLVVYDVHDSNKDSTDSVCVQLLENILKFIGVNFKDIALIPYLPIEHINHELKSHIKCLKLDTILVIGYNSRKMLGYDNKEGMLKNDSCNVVVLKNDLYDVINNPSLKKEYLLHLISLKAEL